MLISHRHQFVFVKTKKTAGTSIEISLSRYMGAADVITPIAEEDEAIRRRLGVVPRNYELTVMDGRGRLRERKLRNHSRAKAARDVLGERTWNEYFVFTVERNPFDRILSQFYWRGGYENFPSVMAFLDSGIPKPNSWIYQDDDGSLLVDYIIRYDRLQSELEFLALGLGIDFDGYLPWAKSGTRKDRRPWQEVLSEQETLEIRARFEQDFVHYENPRRFVDKLRRLGASMPT